MLCDNATGDPVQMDLGAAASELTLGVVAVNAETSRMLHSYAERPPQGEIYRLYTENCPFSLETFVSQVRTPAPSLCACVYPRCVWAFSLPCSLELSRSLELVVVEWLPHGIYNRFWCGALV